MRIESQPHPQSPKNSDPIPAQASASCNADNVDEFEDSTIRNFAKQGAEIGFKTGCTVSLVGIPFSNCLDKSRYNGHKSKDRLSARKAKRRLPLVAVLCLPGVVAGAIGAGIGTLVGAAYGSLKPKKST